MSGQIGGQVVGRGSNLPPVVAGSFALVNGTGSWGTGPSLAVATGWEHGTSKGFRITVTYGTSPSAGLGTVVLTFPEGAIQRRRVYQIRQNGGNASTQTPFWTSTTTTLTITHTLSSPVAGQTLSFEAIGVDP